jgi:ubiquinone/menaquinone biosynthesis C-methylase UbiE
VEFTGERYIPSEDGQIKYEHLHRYALCLEFVSGKAVLDLACGEGYGAALMANVAKSVTGVDISGDTVEYARHRYHRQNLSFIVGSCEKVPLQDASVDIVTSFETIEHHDRHEEMMQEIKRVLKPGGLLIISSPNRLTYSDEQNYSNPFHIKELYFDEFDTLLGHYFKHVQMYGQRLATGSFVYSLENSTEQHLKTYTGNIDHLTRQAPSLPAPIYFVAICSDEPVIKPNVANSVYIDGQDDLFKKTDDEKVELARLAQDHLKQTEEWADEISKLEAQLSELETQ